MIGRRTLLAGLAATAAAPRAGAQQLERRRVVAIVLESSSPAEMAGPDPVSVTARALIHGLRDLGWIEGRNLIIERRTAANQPDRALPIMAELVGRGVDVIMISGAEWLRDAARRTTSTVPLVATFDTADPAAMGVESLARPGGNLTGTAAVTGFELASKRLEILKELAPNTQRIAWLGTRLQKQRYAPDAGPAGTRIVHAVAETLDQFDDAFALIVRERCDAIHVAGSGVHFVHRCRTGSIW